MPVFNPVATFNQSFTLGFSGASTATVANSAAETSIMPATAAGTRTIPANWLTLGRTVRVIINGVYTQPAIAGTMTVRVKVGGTVVASGTTGSLLALAGAAGFRLSSTFTVPAGGTSVALLVGGTFDYQASAFTRQFLDVPSTGNVIDTTIDNTLDVTVQMSTANGTASVKTNTVTVEFLRADSLVM